MAIDTSLRPGMKYAMYIASETTLGTEETLDANFVSLDLNTPVDVAWGTGLNVDDTPRTGQLVRRPTDYFATPTGSTHQVDWEWSPSHKEGVDLMLGMVSEDASSPYSVDGNFLPAVYVDGATTGSKATVIIKTPNAADANDRTLTGCVLSALTISGDNGTAGSRMVMSGTFVTGYDITQDASAVSPAGAETAYAPVIADLTTVTYDGNDLLLEGYSITFDYPFFPLGSQGAGLEPQMYSRGNLYALEGEITVKSDANTDAAITALENGTSSGIPIIFSGTNFGVTIAQAVVTGYTPDLTNEKAGYVTLAFKAAADGAEALYTITTA